MYRSPLNLVFIVICAFLVFAETNAQNVLFIRGGSGTGGFLEGGSDEQLSDITNYSTSNRNHGWGQLADALRNEGYQLTQMIEGPVDNNTPIDLANMDLSLYDVIVFGSNNADYSIPAINALENYIRSGGAALFISDANWGQSYSDAPNSDQQFLDRFGWIMNQDKGTYSIFERDFLVMDNPVLEEVNRFDGEGVSPITLVDDNVNGVSSTILANAKNEVRRNDREGAGSLTAVNNNDASCIIATVDHGRIAGHFDRNTFFNTNGAGTNLGRFDNRQYALNLFDWLANGSSMDLPIPGRIEAESYVRSSGIQTEMTTDREGGLNISHIENGDFVEYEVDIAQADTYVVAFRVASIKYGGSISISMDGDTLGSLSVPLTGAWQNWITLNSKIELPAGPQTLKLSFAGESGYLFNINYLHFSISGDVKAFSNANYRQAAQEEMDKIKEQSSIYPNPVIRKLYLEGFRESESIDVYNMGGVKVSLPIMKTPDRAIIEVQSLQKGVYMISQGGKTFRFVKI